LAEIFSAKALMPLLSLLKRAPWWVKIPAKLVLRSCSRSQHFWRRYGLFQHGFMLEPGYALGVFQDHLHMAQPYLQPKQDYTLLEMGPGDSLATAPIARAYGSACTWLLDVDSAAEADLAPYQQLCQTLRQPGSTPYPELLADFSSREEMLRMSRAHYRYHGLPDWADIPSGSVHWVFSHAVLEHVWLHDLRATLAESYRVLAPGAVATHCIDMGDHFNNSLHSLRLPAGLWESRAFRTSGFYTNRLRLSQWCQLFTELGFEIKHCRPVLWEQLPLPRRALQPEFAQLSDQDLLTHTVYLTLQKPHECS
jgi:hypothetical protein